LVAVLAGVDDPDTRGAGTAERVLLGELEGGGAAPGGAVPGGGGSREGGGRAGWDDPDTRAAGTAERVLLAELEAGCSAPVGAIAEVVESIDEEGRVFEEGWLRGCVGGLGGSEVIRASGIGTPGRAVDLGVSVAAELFELGARELIADHH